MKKNNKGFSLIELIIVISILAILALVATVSLMRYLERSKKIADVNSAKALTEEFRAEYYSNPELYATVNTLSAENTGTFTKIIAWCDSTDDEWTVADDSALLAETLNDSCPIRPIRYTKTIDPSYTATPEEEEDGAWKYALGSWNDFTPKGWAIAVVDNKPVVFVTNGKNLTQGVSPLVCEEYPGPGYIE